LCLKRALLGGFRCSMEYEGKVARVLSGEVAGVVFRHHKVKSRIQAC
jgi:hypothetical protein